MEAVGKDVRNLRLGDRGVDPSALLTKQEPLPSAIDAYRAFDTRQPGWLKVELLAA